MKILRKFARSENDENVCEMITRIDLQLPPQTHTAVVVVVVAIHSFISFPSSQNPNVMAEKNRETRKLIANKQSNKYNVAASSGFK